MGVGTDFRAERLIDSVKKSGVSDVRVLDAMRRVARDKFLSPAMAVDAYADKCLPIGERQTISMPSVVANMTAALGLRGDEKVLEIGTGCGYQTALLCLLARRVYTIERFQSLSDSATQRLSGLGYRNFVSMVGDGTLGWEIQAPFDRILVTAAGPSVPQALIDQLVVGGVMVIPVGEKEDYQNLIRIKKIADSEVVQENLGKVFFVPLVGKQGLKNDLLRVSNRRW